MSRKREKERERENGMRRNNYHEKWNLNTNELEKGKRGGES